MKKALWWLALLLLFLIVVTCGILFYVYYGIGERFQEKNADTWLEETGVITEILVSGTLNPSPSSFEEEFYADLSDLFDANENFYQEIQGEYGFTSGNS